ncbi:hypothetical protein [Streptosporangium canum]|uniref:hypothetical protein n=1 Tax=Streptosporangium canum TaxID=324952 RepID=UPI00379DC818
MPETPAEAVQAALSSLRLLPRGRLPEWRVDLDSRVLLCDMQPPVWSLDQRLDVLRVWSALLGAPVGYEHRPNGSGYIAGYLHVRVVRDGVDARVRAFITPTEAAHADVLTILHSQETTHAE